MNPKETLKQISKLTEILVELSLSNQQNFPKTLGEPKKSFEITLDKASNFSVAQKNVAYLEIYRQLDQSNCFNVKMVDGALISFRYRFSEGKVIEHVLCYFPSPELECFQNDPQIYMEDEVYAEIVSKNIVSFPIRFDFSSQSSSHVEERHPITHLTLGQYKNCRIPVSAPLGPFAFGRFILRNFYNTAFYKYAEVIPQSASCFPRTITAKESELSYFSCGN